MTLQFPKMPSKPFHFGHFIDGDWVSGKGM